MAKSECKILITFFFIVMFLFYIGIPIPCIFHKITNLYCPGCGVTRMVNAIFHLDFKAAFSYNAYVFILLVLSLIYLIIKYILKKNIKISNIVIYILIIIALVFAILRNIEYFSYLAP